MKLTLQLLFIAVSILDIPGQIDKVLVEAECSSGRTVRVIVKRADLDKAQTLENLESILRMERCN